MSLAKPIGSAAAAVPLRPVKGISRRSILAAPLGWALAGTVATAISLDVPPQRAVPARQPIPDIDEYTW